MSDDEPRYLARGLAIYDGYELLGVMVSPESAVLAVDAMNARYRVLAYREEHYLAKDKPSNADPLQRCNPETGYHSTPHRGCVLR